MSTRALASLGGSKLRLLLTTPRKQHTSCSPSVHLLLAFRSSPARLPLIPCSPSAHLPLAFCLSPARLPLISCSPSARLPLSFRLSPASFLLPTLTNCQTTNYRLPLFNQFIVSDANCFPSNTCSCFGFCLNLALAKPPPPRVNHRLSFSLYWLTNRVKPLFPMCPSLGVNHRISLYWLTNRVKSSFSIWSPLGCQP